MTVRPIFPEHRNNTVHVAVALCVVITALLLVAGCVGWLGGKYIRDQDVEIIKLNPNGLIVWKKVIDTGNYDHALDFKETADGGFVIVGGKTQTRCDGWPRNSYPAVSTMTRLSRTGEILWEREYSSKIVSVIQYDDGSFSAMSQ